jgi:hypothetical protein
MRTSQLQPDLSGTRGSSTAPDPSEEMRDRVTRSGRGRTNSDVSNGLLVVIHGGDAPAPSAVAPAMPVAHVRTWTRSACEQYRMPLCRPTALPRRGSAVWALVRKLGIRLLSLVKPW